MITNEDFPGQESATNGADHTPARKTSAARIAANRGNARRSTGPTTEAGKRRSATNSVKHGVFSRGVQAIEAGKLQEDPEVVGALIGAVVNDLTPRDSVEVLQAESIAQHYLQLNRLSRWEASLLERAGSFSLAELQLFGSEDRHEQEYELTQVIEWVLHANSDEYPGEYPEPRDFARLGEAAEPDEYRESDFVETMAYGELIDFLNDYARADKKLLSSRGPWKPKSRARTRAEQRLEFLDVVAHFWPQGGLETWLRPIRGRHLIAFLESRGRLARVSADRALDALDRTTDLRARIGGQLLRDLAIYVRLQARELPDSSPVEP